MNPSTHAPTPFPITERLAFTPLQMENIYRHFAWNNDRELNRLDSEVPYEEESFGDFKRRFERMVFRPSPDALDFELHTHDGALIGVASITDLSPHHRHGTLWVTIGDRAYWGQGYGREALFALLDYGFHALALHRMSAETFAFNAPWRNLVRDAGFRLDGAERDYLYRDGQYWDKEVYSLLESEYGSRQVQAA